MVVVVVWICRCGFVGVANVGGTDVGGAAPGLDVLGLRYKTCECSSVRGRTELP